MDVRSTHLPPDCPNIWGVSEDKKLTVSQGTTCNTSALGYRIQLGKGEPDGGSIRWRVLRPNSINIQPKLRGARLDWAQLCGAEDIKKYISTHGITKSSLLSVVSNLFDPLSLAGPFVATARMLYRKVLREVGETLSTWKSPVPTQYHGQIANLAQDILTVANKLGCPRRAIIPNPIAPEAHQYPIGFTTLLLVCDGSCEAGCAAVYVHQQFPFPSSQRNHI